MFDLARKKLSKGTFFYRWVTVVAITQRISGKIFLLPCLFLGLHCIQPPEPMPFPAACQIQHNILYEGIEWAISFSCWVQCTVEEHITCKETVGSSPLSWLPSSLLELPLQFISLRLYCEIERGNTKVTPFDHLLICREMCTNALINIHII